MAGAGRSIASAIRRTVVRGHGSDGMRPVPARSCGRGRAMPGGPRRFRAAASPAAASGLRRGCQSATAQGVAPRASLTEPAPDTPFGRQVRGSMRGDVRQVSQIDDDRRLASGQASQPRPRYLSRRGPTQVQRDVARGDAIGERLVGCDVTGDGHAGGQAEVRDVGHEVVVFGHRAREEQVGAGNIGPRGGERGQHLRDALVRRQPAVAPEDDRVRRDAVACAGAPRGAAGLPDRQRRALAKTNRHDRGVRHVGLQAGGDAPGRGPRRVCEARATSRVIGHVVVEMVVEARDRELRRVGVGVGMIPGELGAVVVGPEPRSKDAARAWCRCASCSTVRPGYRKRYGQR